jgi:nucleotide-binding universal stress UspA family protein
MQTVDDAGSIFSRILVPVDFSHACHSAVYAALELQRVCGARVCVFNLSRADENDHFLSGLGNPATSEDIVLGASAAVQRFVNNIAPGQADAVECEAMIGDDYVAGICAKARAWGASLLVLSREPHHGVLRTHSEKIMNSIHVPVLLIQTGATS